MAACPRKVLFVHHSHSYDGSATSMLTLIRRLDPARYTASVLIVNPLAEPLLSSIRASGIGAQHLPTRLVHDVPWYWRLNWEAGAWRGFQRDPQIAKHLQGDRPDIVHINEHIPVSTGVTAHDLRIPVVWHCRHVFLCSRPLLDPARRVIRTMVDLSECVVCISESEAAQFSSSKVEVVYNSVDFSATDAVRDRAAVVRRSLGIEAGHYLVTAPIPLATRKGAWDFIRAAGIATRLAPEAPLRFLLVGRLPTAGRRHLLRKWTGLLGPRPVLDRARALARRIGVGDRLQFTGFREDIYEIMAASDLIVFPSHLKACGRSSLEAGALRKPILVTMPNKNTGVVLDGKTGLILPEKDPEALGEAIAELARAPEKGFRMGQQAFEHARNHFDPEQQAQKIMALYDRVLTRPTPTQIARALTSC